jgi:hypothetical protein
MGTDYQKRDRNAGASASGRTILAGVSKPAVQLVSNRTWVPDGPSVRRERDGFRLDLLCSADVRRVMEGVVSCGLTWSGHGT